MSVSGDSPVVMPHLLGTISETKAKGKELHVTDAIGREIIHAEILTPGDVSNRGYLSKYLDTLVEVEVHTISPANGPEEPHETIQKVFVKVNSIQLGNAAFKSKLEEHLPGWVSYVNGSNPESLLKEVMNLQAHQSLEVAKTTHEKLKVLKDLNLTTEPTDDFEDVLSEWAEGSRTHSFNLSNNQLTQLVTQIEEHRTEWLEEAENKSDKKGWIDKKVFIPGVGNIRVQVYPNTRENVKKLGRIDVRLEFLGQGASKTAYRTLFYETNKVGASTYVTRDNIPEFVKRGLVPAGTYDSTLDTELEMDKKVKEGTKADKFERRNLAKSKSVSVQKKEKKIVSQGKILGTRPQLRTKIDLRLYDPLAFSNLINDPKTSSIDKTEVLVQVLEGLEALHTKGIIHRDLKPGNLFIKKYDDGRLKVVLGDYGLAAKTTSPTKEVVGTEGYIAPEIYNAVDAGRNTNPVPREDLYSLGITMRPFNHLGGLDTSPREEPKDKKSYEWGLWKLSNPSPSLRFQTATEAKKFFLDVLRREKAKESESL